ncbi:hypothetical protein [Gracilibacillus salitolerans]|nr:hypothetical protein [Gracilibacillus salitolerans]
MIFFGAKYQFYLGEEASQTFEMIPYLIFVTIFPILIGMLLRLPKLIIEVKDKKRWTFDWLKLVAIGIPALYIALLPVMPFTLAGTRLLFAKEVMLTDNTTLITTAGIVFGYVLLDILKK